MSGDGVVKLLAVPALPKSTGEAQASAVYEAITEWELQDNIQSMSFDTTASNSGRSNGACVLLEQKLKKELLSLACRHHIHELIVGRVFDTIVEVSSGPNIKIFMRFCEFWPFLDITCPESGVSDAYVLSHLSDVREELIKFAQQQLEKFSPREDYRELLLLSLIYLGTKEPNDIRIRKPGAYHRARWMSKLIYCLKIFLFRSQFTLTARESSAIREITIFIVRFYIKAWFMAPSSIMAPYNDLNLYKDLSRYSTINKEVSTAACKSLSGHLWYLSEKLVSLAFFDDRVASEEKLRMVEALRENDGVDDPPCRIQIQPSDIHAKSLPDFVTKNSSELFTKLNLNTDFLDSHPDSWKDNPSYTTSQSTLKHLKVVNDCAERGVALISAFNPILCQDEEQKQYLLQIVEENRHNMPNANKSTIVNALNYR